MIERLAELI